MNKQVSTSRFFPFRSVSSVLHLSYTPYILLFIISLFIRFSSTFPCGDDLYFAAALNSSSPVLKALKDFISIRYQTWSSRVLIEIVLAFLSPYHNIWCVLDALIMTIIPFALTSLFNTPQKSSIHWLSCGVIFLLLKSSIIRSAGWIATTVNYTWPIALGLLSIIPAKKILYGEKCCFLERLFSLPALLFAASHEQCCLILLGILSALFLYLVVCRKQISYFIAFDLVLLFLNLALILLCPGNPSRFNSEVTTWFPTYTQLSLLSRIELGFSSTGFLLMMKTNWFFISFCLILCLLVFLNRKDTLSQIIATIPLASCMLWGPLAGDLRHYFPKLIALRDVMMPQGTIATITPRAFIPDLVLLTVFCCSVYALFICFPNKHKSLFMVYVFMVSLASRFIMGFSPTIWASEERTSLFMYFGLLSLCLMMLQEIDSKLSKEHVLRRISYYIPSIILFASIFETLL